MDDGHNDGTRRTGPNELRTTGRAALARLDRALGLKPAVALQLVVVLAYLAFRTRGVPAHNELVYLLHLAKQWNPTFLAHDWTFAGPLGSHFVFNLLFGPLTLAFSLEVVGWIGRILSWSFVFLALLPLAKHFRIPPWMTTISILLWLFYGQSIVGGEWILGPFEAKTVAYGFVFLGLGGVVRQRSIFLPAAFLGLAFTFHPVVGLWAALAIGLTLVVRRHPIGALTRFALGGILFALPGLVVLLTTPVDNATDAWRFVTLVVMPYHFDPFSFTPWKLLVLAVLLAFNWWHFRSTERTAALELIMYFQAFLGLFFVLGYAARFAESYAILRLMPCRLFPVLLPLFFFFHLMSSLRGAGSIRSLRAAVAGAFAVLALLGVPAKLVREQLKASARQAQWMQEPEALKSALAEEDLKGALRWVAGNTPSGTVVILPPWRKDSYYLARRAQIANWWVLRFDRLTEWRERLEMLVGDLSILAKESETAKIRRAAEHYSNLSETDIAAVVERFGAEYLVSSTSYPHPVVSEVGRYRVYALTPSPPGR